MTGTARTRFSVDERRSQLLEMGLRLFSERAYDEVSIDDIARAAGVSKGLLYHYFGGKRAFYVACVEAAAEELLARTFISDERVPEPMRAQAGLQAYLDFVEENERAYVTLMRSGIGNDPEVASLVERTRSRIVDRALEAMGLDPPRPVFRAAMRSWIGAVEAACSDWLDHRDLPREQVVQVLLFGLWGLLSAAKLIDPDAPFELPVPSLS